MNQLSLLLHIFGIAAIVFSGVGAWYCYKLVRLVRTTSTVILMMAFIYGLLLRIAWLFVDVMPYRSQDIGAAMTLFWIGMSVGIIMLYRSVAKFMECQKPKWNGKERRKNNK